MRSFWIACSQLRIPALSLASLFLIYLLPNHPHSHQIYAVNGESVAHEDHNHPRILGFPKVSHLGTEAVTYESDFVGFDRSITGRAEEDDRTLVNNVPGQLNIDQGEEQYWTFAKQSFSESKVSSISALPSSFQNQPPLSTRTSPDDTIVYISLNTCKQPDRKSANGTPQQLELYVSTNSANKHPGAANHDYAVSVDEGFGSLNISVKTDVHVGIEAPADDDFTGIYNYQLTASVDGPFASYYESANLDFIDSDTTSALLYTKNVTSENSSSPIFQRWLNEPPRFSIFIANQDSPSIQGMQHSVCALNSFARISDPSIVDTDMTVAGDGKPKQQFHVKSLNASSTYDAYATVVGNSTDFGDGVVGGGGMLWTSTSFKTKSDANCALLYNLTFCTSVAYSAPANLTKYPNVTALGQLYDDYASSHYINFSRSLQQIPCNTTSSAQYSLTRNCNDCDEAYRTWLCAVTIPRCEDFSNPAQYLQPRAVNQSFTNTTLADQSSHDPAFNAQNRSRVYFASSRNPWIDYTVQPGPYKEVLPCEDLCYGLVQSCPASLQFVCPLQDHGLNYTYGSRKGLGPGNITCNFPGVGINGTSDSRRLEISMAWMIFGAALVVMIV